MTTANTGVIEQTIDIEARPEIVFALLTDARQLLRWHGVEAELDAQPGGIYRVRMNAKGETIRGRFVEVVPHRRVVYTWGWEDGPVPVPPESSTVEITLEAVGAGTRLHLLHHGLPASGDILGTHVEGWSHYLDRLSAVGAGRDPGPDPWASGEMGEPRPDSD